MFFSVEHTSKMAMINDMAQLWGLPPSLTPEGTPVSLEEAQVRFTEVFSLLYHCFPSLRRFSI